MIRLTNIWIVALVLQLKLSEAQNLVPNSSFEDVNFDYCGLFSSVDKFEASNKHWLGPTDSTPEIVSTSIDPSCWNYINSSSVWSPKTGKRAAVILLYDKRNFRSYLQIELSEALRKGKVYCTEIFVRTQRGSQSVCNNIGLYFSDTLVREKTRQYLNFQPQINHNEILRDTSTWISLKGRFKATSDAKYLLIGNFYNNENTKTKMMGDNIRINPEAIFCFIDDISVKEDN